ncbi:hypothetical protein OG225_42825 (plasmid) [Nocardia sp. NBC_01377]|uniref:hypothetical protein n=1 Tax=Nocardia sp. NBC_01377 TaxID=2903595 RepID=UPI002F909E93
MNSITALLAVTQPTPEGGPFENIVSRFLNLLYFFSGAIAVGALIAAVAIYYYQKLTMQKSEVLSWIFMGCLLLGVAAMAAQIVNWASSGS